MDQRNPGLLPIPKRPAIALAVRSVDGRSSSRQSAAPHRYDRTSSGGAINADAVLSYVIHVVMRELDLGDGASMDHLSNQNRNRYLPASRAPTQRSHSFRHTALPRDTVSTSTPSSNRSKLEDICESVEWAIHGLWDAIERLSIFPCHGNMAAALRLVDTMQTDRNPP